LANLVPAGTTLPFSATFAKIFLLLQSPACLEISLITLYILPTASGMAGAANFKRMIEWSG
jgi:hypothetical protein